MYVQIIRKIGKIELILKADKDRTDKDRTIENTREYRHNSSKERSERTSYWLFVL